MYCLAATVFLYHFSTKRVCNSTCQTNLESSNLEYLVPIIPVGSNRSMETGQPLRLKYACEISNRLETLIEKQSLEVLNFIRVDFINFIC